MHLVGFLSSCFKTDYGPLSSVNKHSVYSLCLLVCRDCRRYGHSNSNSCCRPVKLRKKGRQCKYAWHNIEARSRNHFCCRKAISIKYYECVSVALVIQYAMRMGCFILSSVAWLAVPYFSTLSRIRYDFRGKKKKVISHKMCFDFVYNFCLIYFSF